MGGHRYGFGTYMHFIKGYLNSDTKKRLKSPKKLIAWARGSKSRVHLDTIISPSFTSAIAQCVHFQDYEIIIFFNGVRP